MNVHQETATEGGVRALVIGPILWSVSMIYSFFRVSLWIFDFVVLPLMWLFFAAGVGCTVFGLVAMRSRLGAGLAVITLPLMVVVTATVGAWWWVSPKVWFASHRALYEQAAAIEIGDGYYGRLPVHLRFLTAQGLATKMGRDGTRFFPQWTGVPDDAGGFFYRPSGSPDGLDMYGMICRSPIPLGGRWWMCGVSDR